TICGDRNAGETPVKRSSKRISEKMDNDKNASTQFGVRRLVAAFHSHAARSISSRHFSQWTGLGSPQPRRHRCDLLRDLIFSHCFDFRLGHRPASFKSTQNLTTRLLTADHRPLAPARSPLTTDHRPRTTAHPAPEAN